MSTIIKLSPYVTILQEYYITNRHKCENTKRYISMNSTKGAHELQKENSRDEHGAWKDRALDGLPKIHASIAHLWLATGRIHKLQAPRSEHEDPRSQNSPTSGVMNAKWRAGTSTRISINLNQKHSLKTVS